MKIITNLNMYKLEIEYRFFFNLFDFVLMGGFLKFYLIMDIVEFIY